MELRKSITDVAESSEFHPAGDRALKKFAGCCSGKSDLRLRCWYALAGGKDRTTDKSIET